MAHDIDHSTGAPAFAFVGETPWHGLGEKLESGASIESWIRAAKLEWSLKKLPVRYVVDEQLRTMNDQFVIVRSDNSAALSVVSSKYSIVQPQEVLEFYRDLVGDYGFTLETAGALDGGRKFWALARTGRSDFVDSKRKDGLAAYVLLASSCDKSLATTAAFTSIRVVCANTLGFAMEDVKGARRANVKIPRDTRFNPQDIKEKLGLLDSSWKAFVGKARLMTEYSMDEKSATAFFNALLGQKQGKPLSNKAFREQQTLIGLFNDGPGHNLDSAKETLWGAVNATTRFVDHVRTSSTGERLDNAWFGPGNLLKARAWEIASELVK